MATPAAAPPQGSIFPRMTPALVLGPIVSEPVPPVATAPGIAPLPVETVSAASAPRSGGTLTEAEMRDLLSEAGWPTELHGQAMSVAWCESKWSPGAHGDGGNSLGLFQIGVSRPGWQGWFHYFGEDESLAYDALTNARVAWRIYQYGMDRYGYGWGPWSCKPIG